MMHWRFHSRVGRTRKAALMSRCISFYGGTTHGRVTLAFGHTDTVEINRDVWFDQDFNGHWLVGAVEHDGMSPGLANGGKSGAILVKSAETMAFLTLLSKLIADPEAFH